MEAGEAVDRDNGGAWIEAVKRSAVTHTALAVVLVGVVGYVDFITGRELTTSIFYLLPVWYATWRVGRWPGYAVSLLCAVAWFVADFMASPTYSHPLIPYWNALVELGSCLVLAHVLAALRNAMRMQDQLTAFVVHDLRAPLANIMMALDLVLRTAGKNLDTREKRLVRIATEAGGQMSRLINTLLDLSRLRHHSMPVESQAVDVGEINGRAAKIMTPWAEDRGVEIVVEPLDEQAVGFGDPDVTHRVIVNLLSNAIKYSPKGGKVTLSAGGSGDGCVAICVTDQGPGIPREWRDKAFDMFAQLEAQRGKAAMGSGLGLAFARMAVEAQGGRIWLESGDETGTTVTFTLPKHGPALAAQAEK